MKDDEMLYLIKDTFRKIAEYQIRKKKSLFWAKLHYLLGRRNELKSKCCGSDVRKDRFYSSKKKRWLESFYVCYACDEPCKVEKRRVA